MLHKKTRQYLLDAVKYSVVGLVFFVCTMSTLYIALTEPLY